MKRNRTYMIIVTILFYGFCYAHDTTSNNNTYIIGPKIVLTKKKVKFRGLIGKSENKKIVSIYWDIDDNNVDNNSTTIETVFKKEGIHKVTLHTKIDSNQVLSYSLTVIASNSGIFIGNIPESLHISINDVVHFQPNILSINSIKKYKWYFKGDRIWQFASNKTGDAKYKYTKEKTYNSILSVTDIYGNQTRDTVTVIVTNLIPTLTIPPDTIINGSDSVLFYAKIKDDGKNLTIKWDFDGDNVWDKALTKPNSFKYKYINKLNENGIKIFYPKIEVIDNDNNIVTKSFKITVNFSSPKADAGKNTIVCPNDTILYNGWQSLAMKGEIEKWKWDFNSDGIIDTVLDWGEVKEPAPSIPGSYWAKLYVEDNFGNTSSPDSVKIVVMLDYPVAIVDSVATVEIMDTVTFNGRGYKKCGNILEYAWDFDGNGAWDWRNEENKTLFHVYKSPGIYYAKFQVVGDDGLRRNTIRTVRVLKQKIIH